MQWFNRNKIRLVLLVFAVVVAGSMVVPRKTSALSGVDFNASRIIDDTVFFNSSTQNITDIQAFLNAKVPSCDTWGALPSNHSGYPTRADWGRANGNPPPYTCLRDFSQSIGNIAGDSYCGAIGTGTKSAANLIYDVARACGINTQTLIVLLQKEQALVTDDWPWPVEYQSATGYGCPDTAACDAQYYGFFNQVYNAAHQFKRYALQPSLFNYAAGRTSFVAYQANNPGCGGTNLTLQNSATAALYNYTPYQPNPAALNNLYGTGDGCSAYGNRNFWRLFNDWFGPTLGDLVRTPNNATVYLISGNNKYPIADGSVLNDFSALGPIRYVTDEYVGLKTTGPVLGHMVGGSDGTLYFVNAGIKLPFTSCSMVSQFGYSCAQVTTLTDGQLSRLITGPYITPFYATTSGKEFYINGGQKREVFDQQSLTAAGLGGATNTLLEGGLNYLPYGAPVIRDGVVAASRTSGLQYYYESNRYLGLGNSFTYNPAFLHLPHNYMDDVSMPQAQRVEGFNGMIKNNAANSFYIIDGAGKAALTDSTIWAPSYTTMSDGFLSGTTNSSSPINNQLVKSGSNSTVYYVAGKQKRPITGWNDLLSLNPQPLVINTLSDATINSIASGPNLYGPGSMVKTASSSTVYIVKNSTELFPISSFIFPQELGLPMVVRTMPDADLASYTVGGPIQNKVVCNGTSYVASLGSLYSVTSGMITNYGFSQGNFIDVGLGLCAALQINSAPLGNFIHTSNGTIYYISGGQKQGFTSYTAFTAHGGTSSNTLNVSDYLASTVPTGSNITQ